MVERRVTVVNAHGIHARPAAEIVKLAARFTSGIVLEKDGLEVNGKSIMGVMMLASYLVFLSAAQLERLLGSQGEAILGRLLGVLLAALAVQYVADGVRALAP